MPDVVLPYAPADGATLDPAEVNKDLYEVPANLPAGRLSLLETSNGAITFDNLDPTFKVRSHMIRPWQVGKPASSGLIQPMDFFQNAWGQDKVFYGVAGANLTFYQPYDLNLALFFASFFVSIWRQRGKKGNQNTWADAPEILVRCRLDGVDLPHTNRPMPETIYYEAGAPTYGPAGAEGYDYTFAREERLTRFYNIHHPKRLGGSAVKGTDQLTKGHHTFGLHVYVAQNVGTEKVDRDGVDLYPLSVWKNMHRLRVFVRHADVLPFL